MATRREIATARAQLQQIAQARVSVASTTAAIATQIEDVGGTIPPNLSDKLQQIEDRVRALE